MHSFLRRYQTNLGLILGAAVSGAWGVWQGLPIGQSLLLLGMAILMLLFRLGLDQLHARLRLRRVRRWCQQHGWTDEFIQERQFYAFPPHAVMPLPVPQSALNRPTRAGRIWKTLQTSWMSLISIWIGMSLVMAGLTLVVTVGLLILKLIF